MFDTEGLDELIDVMDIVSKEYPKEIKKFMQNEGNELKARTIKTAKARVNTLTGNYIKGIKRGKYYKYRENGADSIRVYSGRPAYHGHLIEYGHEIVTSKGKKTGKYVPGHLVFKASADSFEGKYEKDCENFADKITAEFD